MITSKSLAIGKTYTLKYQDPWTNYDVLDVSIVSITNNSQSALFSNDSVFSLFFSAYGLGVETYVSTMNSIPDIYVCQIVKGRDPFKIDKTGGYVLIPKLIVDFDKTEELLQCDNISFNVSGLINYFDLDIERSNFNNGLRQTIQKAVSNTAEFGSVPVNVVLGTSTILKPAEEFKTYDDFRTASSDLNELADLQIKDQFAKQQKDNIEAYAELQGKIANYEALLVDVQEKVIELDTSIDNYGIIKSDVHNLRGQISALFNGLEDGSITVSGTEYNALKLQIESYIINF